ncbi:MAG: hypothetical protein V4670_08315 [Bacteroidota bacterium]
MIILNKKWWLLFVGFFLYLPLQSQEQKTEYVTVTTLHRNTSNPDLKREDWLKIEKEYFDKVVMKNPLILGYNLLTHFYTANSSEVIIVNHYGSWEAIDKSWDKSQELIKQAWPDEKARKDFFEKRSSFYENSHSDEIYVVLPNSKSLVKIPDKQMIYYVRKTEFANNKNGSAKEFDAMNKEFVENVFHKNELIKAYYSYQHAWGSRGAEFVEVSVYDNLSDLEKAGDRDEDLIKQHWPNEVKLKEFDEKLGGYFIRSHGDYIYRNEIGFQK